jgi:hypothetical protein
MFISVHKRCNTQLSVNKRFLFMSVFHLFHSGLFWGYKISVKTFWQKYRDRVMRYYMTILAILCYSIFGLAIVATIIAFYYYRQFHFIEATLFE